MKQRRAPQVEAANKHPEPWRQDLNPDALAGQNIGAEGEHPEKAEGQSLYDIKTAHRLLNDLSADDLKELRLLPYGTRLQADATYIDLWRRDEGEIKATPDMVADQAHWYVAKKDVSYELWNRLLGVRDVKRTGTAG